MTEREAFIKAIAANPADEAGRLAFADWLQENGEEDRAEFVRLLHELMTGQRELEGIRQPSKHLLTLQNRIQKLFTSCGATWLGPFYQALGAEFPPARREPWSSRLWRRVTGSQTDQVGELFKYLHFGRVCIEGRSDELIRTLDLWSGFVSSLQISLEARLPIRDIAAAFRREPVNSLRIAAADNFDQWSRLNKPCLARSESLTVEMSNERNRQTIKVVEDILHGQHWSGLKHLGLWHAGNHFQPESHECIEQLAHSPLLSNIHSLSLMIEQPDIRPLTHLPQIANLRRFRTCGRLTPEATGAIASATFRPNLEELNLSLGYLEGDWTRALAAVVWPKLRSLDLGYNQLTDAGVRSLLPLVPRLTDLCLCSSNITDTGALALADAIDPEKMENFWLNYNPLSLETVDALRARFGERFHFTASTGSP